MTGADQSGSGALYISHLEIRRFSQLRARSLDLSPGLNVIVGSNESGKSTIKSFIEYEIFGEVGEHVKEDEKAGSLRLVLGEHSLEIDRSATNGRSKKITAKLELRSELRGMAVTNGPTMTTAKSGQNQVVEFLGGLTANAFRDFYCFDIADMVSRKVADRDLATKIHESTFIGGGVSPSKVAAVLAKRANEMWPPRSSGPISALADEFNQLRGKRRNLTSVAASFEGQIAEREDLNREISMLKVREREIAQELRKCGLARELWSAQGRLSDCEQDLVEFRGQPEIAKLHFSEIERTLVDFEQERRNIWELESEIAKLRSELAQLDPNGFVAAEMQRIEALLDDRSLYSAQLASCRTSESEAAEIAQQVIQSQESIGLQIETAVSLTQVETLFRVAQFADELQSLELDQDRINDAVVAARHGHGELVSKYLGKFGEVAKISLAATSNLAKPGVDDTYLLVERDFDELSHAVTRAREIEGQLREERNFAISGSANFRGKRSLAIAMAALGTFAVLLVVVALVSSSMQRQLRYAVVAVGLIIAIGAISIAFTSIRSDQGSIEVQRRRGNYSTELADELGRIRSKVSNALGGHVTLDAAQGVFVSAAFVVRELSAIASGVDAFEIEIGEHTQKLEALSLEKERRFQELGFTCGTLIDPTSVLGDLDHFEREVRTLGGLIPRLNEVHKLSGNARTYLENFEAQVGEVAKSLSGTVGRFGSEAEVLSFLSQLATRTSEVASTLNLITGLSAKRQASRIDQLRDAVIELEESYGIGTSENWSQYRDVVARGEPLVGLASEMSQRIEFLGLELSGSVFGTHLLELAGDSSELCQIEEQLGLESEKLTQRIDKANQTIGELGNAIENARSDTSLVEVNNQMEFIKASFAAAFKDWGVTAVAEQVLNNAVEQLGTANARSVAELASRNFSQMTKGRYVSLDFDPEMPFAMSSGNEVVPITSLSRGTIDLAYLATRFALAEVQELPSTFGTAAMFFVLDDVLVNHDAPRTASVIERMAHIAQGRQIVYFTCHDHVATSIEQICKELGLSSPTMLDMSDTR